MGKQPGCYDVAIAFEPGDLRMGRSPPTRCSFLGYPARRNGARLKPKNLARERLGPRRSSLAKTCVLKQRSLGPTFAKPEKPPRVVFVICGGDMDFPTIGQTDQEKNTLSFVEFKPYISVSPPSDVQPRPFRTVWPDPSAGPTP